MDITTKVFLINLVVYFCIYTADATTRFTDNFNVHVNAVIGAWWLLSLATMPCWAVWAIYNY